MTLPELIERIDRLTNAGIYSDESKLDSGYIESLINSGRAVILHQDFLKFRRWSSEAMQDYYPAYDIYFQDSFCYTRFQLPTGFIQANGAQDGLIYCGSSSNKILTTRAFRRIKSRTELSDMLQHPVMTPANGTYVGVLMEGLMMTLISKERIKEPMITAIFENPMALEDYNRNSDNYPINESMITDLEMYLIKTDFTVILGRNADTISDSSQDKNIKK